MNTRKRVGRAALFILVPMLLIGLALPVLGTLIAPSVPQFVGGHKVQCAALVAVWCALTGAALWLQRDEPTPAPATPTGPARPSARVIITGSRLHQSPIIDGDNNRISFGEDKQPVRGEDGTHAGS